MDNKRFFGNWTGFSWIIGSSGFSILAIVFLVLDYDGKAIPTGEAGNTSMDIVIPKSDGNAG